MSIDKFNWFPSESAHKDFPMKIIKGDFIFLDGGSTYIPDHRLINNGWGEVGSHHIIGENFKPVPTSFVISWFSYIEDKFYIDDFVLPHILLEELFKKGYESPIDGKQSTYKFIIIGLGLGGEIFLWLSGDGIVKEVAKFRAKESDIKIDWSHISTSDLPKTHIIEKTLLNNFNGDKDKVIKAKEHAAQENPWHGYRIKYDWNIEITGTAQPLSIWSKTFNGEKEYISYENGKNCEKAERSVPESMILNWQGLNNKKYSTDIFFNITEIFKAFDKLFTSDSKDTLQIIIEIDANSHSLETYLNNSKYSLPLQKTKIEVFSYV